MTGQEKGDLFIQVAAWVGLTVFLDVPATRHHRSILLILYIHLMTIMMMMGLTLDPFSKVHWQCIWLKICVILWIGQFFSNLFLESSKRIILCIHPRLAFYTHTPIPSNQNVAAFGGNHAKRYNIHYLLRACLGRHHDCIW
jgi:hypothetical protein